MRLTQELLNRSRDVDLREAQFDVPQLDLWLVVGQVRKKTILWRCEL
jgi:hypothetical protein